MCMRVIHAHLHPLLVSGETPSLSLLRTAASILQDSMLLPTRERADIAVRVPTHVRVLGERL